MHDGAPPLGRLRLLDARLQGWRGAGVEGDDGPVHASLNCDSVITGSIHLERTSYNREVAVSDDRSKRGVADRSRININEGHELAYWTKELGCTREQLRAAVRKAGVMASDVRSELGR